MRRRTDQRARWLVAAGALAVAVTGTGIAVSASSSVGGVRPAVHAREQRPVPGGLAATLPAAPRAASRPAPLTASQLLARRVSAALATSSASGIAVAADVAGTPVLRLNATAPMWPASTQKLFTAMPVLGRAAGLRLVTSVAATATPVKGVVHGDLVVTATGDPSLTSADLTALARTVHARGVRVVTGGVVVRIGELPPQTRRPGWKPGYVPDELGPLSPFPVDRDTWRADAAYLAHPTSFNVGVLRAALAHAGVTVKGRTALHREAPPTRVVLAVHSSAAVGRLMARALEQSDNFVAEQLLNVVGGPTVTGAMDGSGLSDRDRQSATAELALLNGARSTAAGRSMLAALPVSCRTGTMRHRLCGPVTAGAVHAKTGSLDHVVALAGYTIDARGRHVTFAILANNVRSPAAARRAVDAAVVLLRRYAG